jgi:ATP-binding cassette subfamily B protein
MVKISAMRSGLDGAAQMTAFERLMRYFRPYWRSLAVGIGCLLINNLAKLTAPLVTRYAIDDLAAAVTRLKLLAYGCLIVVVTLIQGVFLFLQRRALINMSRHIEYDLRNDFYAHLQRLPLEFYQSHRTGDLMARATNDLSAVRMVVGPALMYSGNTLFATALILPAMASISLKLTLIAFFSMPLVAAATQFFGKRIHERFEMVQEYFGEVSNRAQESLAGIRVIRAYAQEEAEIERFREVNREFVNRNLKLIKLSALFHPLLQLFIGLGFVAVLWYGGKLTIDGSITIGQFVQFTLYLGYLVWPMIALGWVINLFQRGMASMGRINQIMSTEPTIRDDESALSDIAEIKGEIEFHNLTFTYPGASRPALEGINLRIAPGQKVAIVGAVGSGKSTLVNLVPRLLDAGPGQVLIDGRPIRQIPLKVLRSHIGHVPQETFLFSETLAENIAFGAEDASREDIEWAASMAGIAQEITSFPKGYQTVVGERGITLSGGQKQRVAIARALIRNPRILILDDALSSVDTYTEEKVLKNLAEVMRGRTCLVVSHRVSTIKDADLIIVLDEGRIVERGTHEELVELGGLYAELYEKQLLEEEIVTS